jgi:hypothetical protein
MYCSHCYQNGQFVLPDISVTEMQSRVREKIIELGIPGFLAGIFTRKIPKLARWEKSKAKKIRKGLVLTINTSPPDRGNSSQSVAAR